MQEKKKVLQKQQMSGQKGSVRWEQTDDWTEAFCPGGNKQMNGQKGFVRR